MSTGEIRFGNTLINDQFEGLQFDYLLANPPFGVDWKAEQKEIDKLSSFRGYTGKLPRVNDGALLFLLHMMGKFEQQKPSEDKQWASPTKVDRDVQQFASRKLATFFSCPHLRLSTLLRRRTLPPLFSAHFGGLQMAHG